MTNDDAKTSAWESSYERRENFVFVPSDEVVRFVSRYLRRRVSLDAVVDVLPGAANSKVLDVGCGIGRNLVFGEQMGLQMWGFDHSTQAVSVARQWLSSIGYPAAAERVSAADIRKLEWPDGFFDHALSDSVLDSMSLAIAKAGIAEIHRVLKPGGLFYCNLMSDVALAAGSNTEQVVATAHEQGTIQTYFDMDRIEALFGGSFDIIASALHSISDKTKGALSGRWNVVLRRK